VRDLTAQMVPRGEARTNSHFHRLVDDGRPHAVTPLSSALGALKRSPARPLVLTGEGGNAHGSTRLGKRVTPSRDRKEAVLQRKGDLRTDYGHSQRYFDGFVFNGSQ
jgi:hypothetical protein